MPEPPAPVGRVVLAGGWPAGDVAALAAAVVVVDAAEARTSPIDWLLAAPGPDGAGPVLALATGLRARSPALRVAVVDPGKHWPAGTGCDVYVAGRVRPGELIAALRLGDRGFRICQPSPVGHATRGQADPSSVGRPVPARGGALAGRPEARGPAGLTVREEQLLRALCAGLSNDRIARELRISRSTVEFHLTRIFKKLGVTSRAEAIVRVLHDRAAGPVLTGPARLHEAAESATGPVGDALDLLVLH
ncbi:response regulator transcription factor [Micromonospora sp. RTGN7]|uniref:helix-turn-helix transcriptional regulator n=1 Tax=Micromonospora sp. RTGN7 TaxID=3016526 RepID=UPI0029FED6C6|nr:response regulator transcription factor [Micromonospora sp. RTGN7]